MVALKAQASKLDHLDLAARFLDAHADNPAVAVCRYINSILPRTDTEFAIEMSGFLIGNIAAMLLRAFPEAEIDQAKRLASTIVMAILPAGADLGMESRFAAKCQERDPLNADAQAAPPLGDLSGWFDAAGRATVLVSEHRDGKSPPSLILLPIEPESQRSYEGHIRAVDIEHDPRPGAWNYRCLGVHLSGSKQ